jgi:hypothetical protein
MLKLFICIDMWLEYTLWTCVGQITFYWLTSWIFK